MARKKKDFRVWPPLKEFTHLRQILPAEAAQPALADYISRSQTNAYLHPDSYLTNAGIIFSLETGPNGGIALHHLKRIEAGLRGEDLAQESREELERLFPGSQSRRYHYAFDDLLHRTARKERRDGGEKGRRKRKHREIADWADHTSEQVMYAGIYPEIESFVNTPIPVHLHDEEEERLNQREQDGWMDKEEFDLQQEVLTAADAIGNEGAPVSKQNGVYPGVIQHDSEGNAINGTEENGKQELTREEKRARKEGKKARKEERKREKAAKAQAKAKEEG